MSVNLSFPSLDKISLLLLGSHGWDIQTPNVQKYKN